jgi:predicted metal-dependent phosphoesterase TrpH
MRNFFAAFFIALSNLCFGQQNHSHTSGRVITFPDIPGYKTLRCDLHQHTVFSDGSVWPDIRIMEALKDSVDAISLTEHLEYQPHKADIPHPDRNRSYEIASREAKNHSLIVIHGSEITRSMPPGHCNAIFITDANKLLLDDSLAVFREAKRQGAFIFWNHPGWTSQRKNGIAVLTDLHKFLIKEKLLDGIEVVNDQTFSDEALQIALDNNLTIMGTSDVHRLIDWTFNIADGGHRPLTLVFAKERSAESIKEALFDRRSVVFYKNILAGRNEFLIPLIQQSLAIKSAKYIGKTDVLSVVFENKTNAEFILQNKTGFGFHNSNDIVTIMPGDKNVLEIKTKQRLNSVQLNFEVLSAVNAPNKHPLVTWQGQVE